MASIKDLLNAVDQDPTLQPFKLLDENTRRKEFCQNWSEFMRQKKLPIAKIPIMGYKELDLFRFFEEVIAFGGYYKVIASVGTWVKIWRRLPNYDGSITDASSRLRRNYERFLFEYEMHCFPENQKNIIELQKPASPKSPKKRNRYISNKNKDVPRQGDGKPLLPVVLGGVEIHCLGKIIPRSPFVTNKNVWPVGFKSSRYFSSMFNPEDRVKYISEIKEVDGRPVFCVTAMDDPENPISGSSASTVWRVVLQRVLNKVPEPEKRTNIAVSGALRFGLAHPTVLKLLQELPNADKCEALKNENLRERSYKKRKIQDKEMVESCLTSVPRMARISSLLADARIESKSLEASVDWAAKGLAELHFFRFPQTVSM